MEAKYKFFSLIACVLSFVIGWHMQEWMHICPVAEPEIKTEIKYLNDTKTEVVYVPKYIYPDGSAEKTDVDVTVDKQELAVKVNGKDFNIQKTGDEKYVFDKNKLQLTQTRRADLNITVLVIDKTKRWEIGIGASKDGVVGMLGFPIKRMLVVG